MGPVSFSPASRKKRPQVRACFRSEMGLGGDWVTHTGETTVFGIVTAPNWHSDVYAEAAQFANSWSPRLRLWSKRLQIVSQDPESDRDKESKYAKTQHKDVAYRAQELRSVEYGIRQHLAQIWSGELAPHWRIGGSLISSSKRLEWIGFSMTLRPSSEPPST